MSQGPIQQTIQSKMAYGCEVALCLMGITLTQWATILGIVATLIGIVLAVLTYLSNKWRNEEIVKHDRERTRMRREEHEMMEDGTNR